MNWQWLNHHRRHMNWHLLLFFLFDKCLLFINKKENISQHPFQNKQLVLIVIKEDIQVANEQEKSAWHHETSENYS